MLLEVITKSETSLEEETRADASEFSLVENSLSVGEYIGFVHKMRSQ